jgi:hypothetical protein
MATCIEKQIPACIKALILPELQTAAYIPFEHIKPKVWSYRHAKILL